MNKKKPLNGLLVFETWLHIPKLTFTVILDTRPGKEMKKSVGSGTVFQSSLLDKTEFFSFILTNPIGPLQNHVWSSNFFVRSLDSQNRQLLEFSGFFTSLSSTYTFEVTKHSISQLKQNSAKSTRHSQFIFLLFLQWFNGALKKILRYLPVGFRARHSGNSVAHSFVATEMCPSGYEKKTKTICFTYSLSIYMIIKQNQV